MNRSATHAEHMKAFVIEQLEKLGSLDNNGYTYKELVRKLAVARAMEGENDARD